MPTRTTIDAILSDALRDVPGVVAMATNAGGTLYEGAAGTRGTEAMTPDTIFGLA
ncbi:MAG: hypothetical protein NT133_27025 [Alphaproteobacteria bacterium]|nr:hypothetical protein [Alphaproteobacteria bacterium]